MNSSTLHVRHLGRVVFHEADTLQRALHSSDEDYLLFLEHAPVYTRGSSTKPEHELDVRETKVPIVDVDRGGSITYHGPGQLVGYPIVTVGQTRGDLRSSLAFIRSLENVLIDALSILGINAIHFKDFTGVWVDRGQSFEEPDRYVKVAAIGVKVAQGRTRHGFALNVSTNMDSFNAIIPCGIDEYKPSSLHELGHTHLSLEEITETITKTFIDTFDYEEVSIASVTAPSAVKKSKFTLDAETPSSAVSPSPSMENHSEPRVSSLAANADSEVSPSKDISRFSSAVSAAQPQLRLLGRLADAGVAVDLEKDRRARPEWLKNKVKHTDGYKELKELSKGLNLHTVCEEAGCPNIYECWEDKTGTFMILGERCTRACGFCLVDTQKPQAPDKDEPFNVGFAVKQLGLEFAVITTVARDDLDDDGSQHHVDVVREIRRQSPNTQIELLISDNRGHADSLDRIFAERVEVINHNIETVARLQRAVRPSASYARSLGVLARAKSQGLTTKSGIIVGMGETSQEVLETLRDLKNIGVDIVTIGQYLQPTPNHLPVHRFVEPSEFEMYKEFGEKLGIAHVESGPLVRSSYHAKGAAQAAN